MNGHYNSNLCGFCLGISFRLLQQGYQHVKTLEELKKSASLGCALCELFHYVVQESSTTGIADVKARSRSDDLPSRLSNVEIEGISLLYDNHYGGKLCVVWREMGRGIAEVGYVHLYVNRDAEIFDKITGRQVLPEADGDEAFSMVREWIIECLYRHHQCEESRQFPPAFTKTGIRQSRMEYMLSGVHRLMGPVGTLQIKRSKVPLLPTRVIDVGDETHEPYLYISPPECRSHYLALSHCWGSVQILTTTCQNLEQRKRSIPVTQFPKTFRDAVQITRKLGLQYLWIDSLCIVQDSKDDWDAESAVMGRLYSQAFLTIAAGGAANSSEGCFLPRPASAKSIVKLQLPDIHDPVYATTYIEEAPCLTPNILDTRAWCLQEAALTPRLLIYGKKMLGWLCSGCQESEQGISLGSNNDIFTALAPRAPSREYFKGIMEGLDWSFIAHVKSTWTNLDSDRGLWNNVVANYTQRSMSFGKDKLPALSGYARGFNETKWVGKQRLQGYYAGLWKGHLPHALLWKAVGGKEMSKSDEWRAPTWSWASLDGPVSYSNESFGFMELSKLENSRTKLTWIVEPSTTPAGKDIYGAVTAGKLWCRLPMLEAKCVERPSPEGCPRYAQLIPTQSSTNKASESDSTNAYAWFDTPMANHAALPTVWCTMLTKTAGLILEQIDQEPKEYQRLGLFQMDKEWGKQAWKHPKFWDFESDPEWTKDIWKKATSPVPYKDYFSIL